jgi:hypothetical protein
MSVPAPAFVRSILRTAARRAVLVCLALGNPVGLARAADGADSGAQVAMQALALLGVPYRFGSDDPARGLDCSGLVRHVFRAVAALDLPRKAVQQSRVGRRIDRHALRAGDLVFFNTLGYANSHVGVYVGEGRFVHAPAQRGRVRIEGLDEAYWRARFNGARRLGERQPLAPAAVAARPAGRAAAESPWRREDELSPGGP